MRRALAMIRIISCAAVLALAGGSIQGQAKAQGAFDGTWEATMTQIHGPELREKSFPPQLWRMVIRGDTARMFIRREGGQFTEVKPGIFKLQVHMTNVLVTSLDSARDGSWIETEAWILIQKAPDILGVIFAGAVKNPRTSNLEILHYLMVRTGEFRRVQ